MKPLNAHDMADGGARSQKVVLFAFLWLAAVTLVAAGFVIAGLLTGSYSEIILGALIFAANAIILRFAREAFVLFAVHKGSEPTEWMRRGGLMAEPEANAKPDETKIRTALSALPQDFPTADRESVESYLAMPDDNDKQLRRDELIRRFYDCAASSKTDVAQGRAYNALRLALSPWAQDEESDD